MRKRPSSLRRALITIGTAGLLAASLMRPAAATSSVGSVQAVIEAQLCPVGFLSGYVEWCWHNVVTLQGTDNTGQTFAIATTGSDPVAGGLSHLSASFSGWCGTNSILPSCSGPGTLNLTVPDPITGEETFGTLDFMYYFTDGLVVTGNVYHVRIDLPGGRYAEAWDPNLGASFVAPVSPAGFPGNGSWAISPTIQIASI